MTDPSGLRRAYEADTWLRPPSVAQQVLVWRFRFGGNEIEGWRIHRVQQTRLEPATSATFSVWQPTGQPAGAALVVNVFETPSAADARECLLRQLGEVQGPPLARIDAAGEVAFGAGRLSVLLARANVVLQVASVERVEVGVADIAAQLDRWIGTVPDTANPVSAPRFRLSREADGKTVRIALEQTDSTVGRWYKFVVRDGTVRADKEDVLVTPTGTEPQIASYVIDQAGNITRAVLQLP